MVGGAAVRPALRPQPTSGATVRLVCAFSSPVIRAGFTVGWCGPCLGYGHTARLVVLGIWHISWGGSARCTGVGGVGSALFSFSDLLWEGPCGTGRELDPLLEGWICRSTRWVLRGASKFPAGTGSLWDFDCGMGEGDGADERLCSPPSCALSSRAQQLSLPLSSSPPVLRAELLAYNLLDVKSRLLSEHTQIGRAHV